MAFNISSFRSNGLAFDGARPSLFEVRVNFPTIASNGTTETSRLRFLAHATSIPETTMDYIRVPYFGRDIKVEGNRTFADWNIEVMNDDVFTIRAAMEAWMNGMNAHISNRKNPAFAGMGYKSTATVYQLSKEKDSDDVEQAIRAYTFSGLFPVRVDQIRLDWGTTNQIESFGVTFAYDYWVPGSDENYSDGGKYLGVDGSAKDWNPKMATDTN
jgi:hypothetical protein